MSDDDVLAIRKMLTDYFADKAMNLADEAWGLGPSESSAWPVVRGLPKGDLLLKMKGRREAGPVEQPTSPKAITKFLLF